MNDDTERSCDGSRDDLAEFSLGILSGRERSTVLAHLEGCELCTAEVERLSALTDIVLNFAPQAEPPIGFESRLAQRFQTSGVAVRPRRLRQASAVSVAAALAILLGVGIGSITAGQGGDSQGTSATASITSAPLSSNGQALGEVFVSAGKPAWLFMSVDTRSISGTVWCQVTLAGGRVETIGTFRISGGYGAWGAALPSSGGPVRSARVISGSGAVLASANLTT
jgi:hypothetical protein